MDDCLLNSIRHRDRLKQKDKHVSSTEYRINRNFLTNLRTTENQNYKNQFEVAQNNYEKIWECITEITNSDHSSGSNTFNIHDDKDKKLNTDKEMADQFNKFFSNIVYKNGKLTL
ncbi:hypothetical protein JTB14_015272 [Gonioctena quinquepunctata]|nr:hypothetical protein JTB14_015272 [Gonioctena quinquepunctata]